MAAAGWHEPSGLEQSRLDAGTGRCWLFVYGLLKPGLRPPRTFSLAFPDRVAGHLYDLGPYPALVLTPPGQPAECRADGFTLLIAEEELTELDEFEDVADGLYRRLSVMTELGFRAWVYEYARRLPSTARGPLSVWHPG